MNIKLSESCLQSYPKQFEYYLEGPSPATCCSFNRHGTLLAIGCSDGKISILDFITRCFARILLGHAAAPVCALSWSRNSRVLLSATADNTIIKWCVETALPVSTYVMPCAVAGLCMHPRRESFAIVSFVRFAAIVLNVNEKDSRRELPVENDDDDENVGNNTRESTMPYYTLIPVDRAELDEYITVATYDAKGHYVIAGTNKGRLNILHADTLGILASCRAMSTGSPTLTAIRQIEVAKTHPYFLINTSDRVIRLFNTNTLLERGRTAQISDTTAQPVEAFCKLQDTVNRSTWRKCVFSGPDDEYVCGGSSRTHTLYIWELQSGAPVQQPLTLKGEALIDLQWHPHRAFLCSVSTNGLVACWTEAHVESYGAYAPSFQELEENLELEEREGEFDIADEDDPTAAGPLSSSSSNSRQSGGVTSSADDVEAVQRTSSSMQRVANIDLDNDDFYRSSDEDECEPNTESALIFITLTPDVLDPVEDPKALKAEQQGKPVEKRPPSTNSAKNMPIKLLLGEDDDADELFVKNSTELSMQIDDEDEPVRFFEEQMQKKPDPLPKSKVLPPRFEIVVPEFGGSVSGQQQFIAGSVHPIMAFIKKEKPPTTHHSGAGGSQPPSSSGKHGRKGSTSVSATSSGKIAEKGSGGKHGGGLNLTITTAVESATTIAAVQQQQPQISGKRWRNGKGK